MDTLTTSLTARKHLLHIMHGHVHERVRMGDTYTIQEKMLQSSLERTHGTVLYNITTGMRFSDKATKDVFQAFCRDPEGNNLPLPWKAPEVIALCEMAMTSGKLRKPLALCIEYSHTVLKEDGDPFVLISLLRWSLDDALIGAGHIVVILTEHVEDISPQLIRPTFSAAMHEVQAPELEDRAHYLAYLLQSEGLSSTMDAKDIANLTAGFSYSALRNMLESTAELTPVLVRRKQRELLQRELQGLVEIIEPHHGLQDIGGLAPIKQFFSAVVRAIKAGDVLAVPRGITLMGPPGVGKTALAEALAKDCGFNFVKLLNPRIKWHGESERRMQKALTVLKTLTPVVVVEDEADQSEQGRDEYSGDSGVGNRLRQMRFDFTGDAKLQGKVLWIRITNRPDKLDKADLRSGRSSERIPFFMPNAEEKEHIFKVVMKRAGIASELKGYDGIVSYMDESYPDVIAGSDIEEIAMRAYRNAAGRGAKKVGRDDFIAAIDDFIPPHNKKDLRDMERLALRQCSSRKFIPKRVWEWAGGAS